MASQTTPDGLTTAEAAARLRDSGPNEVAPPAGATGVRAFLGLLLNPLVLVLLVASGLSAAVGEYPSAAVIAIVVAVSSVIQFVQTRRSDEAVRRLREQVAVTATVRRDGAWAEIPARVVVPGDRIRLAAGDLVPADARVVEARDLHVQQAALTGESLPVEKEPPPPGTPPAGPPAGPPAPDRPDLLFFGTSVVSGTATAEVTATGRATAFGAVAARLAARPPETAFDRGTRRFGLFITQTVLVLVLFVAAVAVARGLPPTQSVLFALALAVGLTPELLPMVVSVTLARGAVRMARRHVVVKHLAAIQNLGSMDVLCTDKTGTLTRGEMTLERWAGPTGGPTDEPFRLAYLNSGHETGIKSPLDAAILARAAPPAVEGYRKVDEVPFDFERRRLSVVVAGPEGALLITKGAPEGVLACCPDVADRGKVDDYVQGLSAAGYRLLAVASKPVELRDRYTAADEAELTLAGFLLFADPVREDAAGALRALARDGVRVVMLTGDNDHVARHVAEQVGLDGQQVVLGTDLDGMTDAALGAVAERAAVFARVSPAQKNRVLFALQARGHVVGFLGDGVNDAPSLHAADVGVSVNTGVDVAKAAAEVILLRPGLRVLHDGILEGRRAFGNVTKYLLMGTSSNFGNMISMAAATAFLPFLPMLPLQVLLNNLLYDLAQLPIPGDRVDPAFVRKPRKWDIDAVRRFMLAAGPVSSLFDLVTFAGLLWLFRATEAGFHTGWFVESLVTQTLVLLVIRTAGNPLCSRPSRWLLAAVVGVCVTAVALPFAPFASTLGFEPLPAGVMAFLAVVAAGYLMAIGAVKRWFFRGPGAG